MYATDDPRSQPGGGSAGPGFLLEIIRSAPAWTRAQLVRASGLARSTVAERLETLARGGFVVIRPAHATTGGRPAEMVSFNNRGGYLLAADIGASHTRFGLSRVDGEFIATADGDLDIHEGPDIVLPHVARGLAELVRSHGVDLAQLRGIGIGVPAPVDVTTGRLIRPPTMPGWDSTSVPGYFAKHFPGVVVRVDKDANIMALGEYRFSHREHPTMVMVKAGMGIGAGLVADGRVLHGAAGAAGDIGHIPQGGPDVCRCGQRGCVEATAGGWAIAARLRAERRQVSTSRDVVDLVRANDPLAVDLVRATGRKIGDVLIPTISVLNPSLIVVGGNLAEYPEPILAGVREVVYSRAHPLASTELQVVSSTRGADSGLEGAAELALDAILAPHAVDAALAQGVTWI